MQLLSSFELIVQPIIPSPLAPAGVPNPVAVQAYFLLLSNPTGNEANIALTFTANPNTDGPSTFTGGGIVPAGANNFKSPSTFLDIVGAVLLPTFTIKDPATAAATFTIPPSGTALFLLQPDVTPLQGLDRQNEVYSYELRGFVHIDANPGVQILVAPQVRGTFFQLGKAGELAAPAILQPEALTMTAEEAMAKLSLQVYSQQAYPLPTAGTSLYSF